MVTFIFLAGYYKIARFSVRNIDTRLIGFRQREVVVAGQVKTTFSSHTQMNE